VQDIPIRGLSITMPYKEDIVEALSNSDPLTRQIGACNTIVRSQDGKLYGFNTDVAGIVVPLEQRIDLAGARILIVGAGGVARAAAFGLKAKGAEVFLVNRTPEKAQALARAAKAKTVKRADLVKLEFDVIINATPVGMGSNKQSPLEDKELNAKYLFDLVYTPAETKLTAMARAKGLQVIPGLEMFVQQGARQFEIWTGKPAPVAEMAYVVTKALERRAAESGEEAPVVKLNGAKHEAAKPDAAKANGAKSNGAKSTPEKSAPAKSSAKAAHRPAAKKVVKKLARK
jgi:3-dehydroquinate dehydratase/shikimate dehydrogenase